METQTFILLILTLGGVISIVLSLIPILREPKKITIDKTRTSEFIDLTNQVRDINKDIEDLGGYKKKIEEVGRENIILTRRVIDLEIGKQKSKFKKGDKVEWGTWVRLTSSPIINTFIDPIAESSMNIKNNGEYICRYIDYDKGCWVAKVLVGCEIEKVKEDELKKIK